MGTQTAGPLDGSDTGVGPSGQLGSLHLDLASVRAKLSYSWRLAAAQNIARASIPTGADSTQRRSC